MDKLEYSEQRLSEFATKEWGKVCTYLQKRYPTLSYEDCEDVFIESLHILHNNIIEKKADEKAYTKSTYFVQICVNKAKELIRKKSPFVHVENDIDLDMLDNMIREDKVDELISLDPENSFVERKEALVRQIVRNLPDPCDKIIWGYFFDNLSLKTLADMYDYTYGSIKVKSHKCQAKFAKRFAELKHKLF